MKSVKKSEPVLGYWGSRQYIHGSHLILAVLEKIEHMGMELPDSFLATFREVLSETATFFLYKRNEKPRRSFPAEFTFHVGGKEWFVGVLGNGGVITQRFPDDEKDLISKALVDEKAYSISAVEFQRARFINTAIAMTKVLHYNLIPDKGLGPWVLARFGFSPRQVNPDQISEVEVRLVSNMGDKMTKSLLLVDGGQIGEIFFNRKTN